jgi:hypothetical protein
MHLIFMHRYQEERWRQANQNQTHSQSIDRSMVSSCITLTPCMHLIWWPWCWATCRPWSIRSSLVSLTGQSASYSRAGYEICHDLTLNISDTFGRSGRIWDIWGQAGRGAYLVQNELRSKFYTYFSSLWKLYLGSREIFSGCLVISVGAHGATLLFGCHHKIKYGNLF